MKRGFTLIELIIVIIIVGILAAIGISQYYRTVEKGRGAEARVILGEIRKLAYDYYLQNGSYTGMTNAYVNIGTSPDQFPSGCRSTHYFWYGASSWTSANTLYACAIRCTSGGKTPQGTNGSQYDDPANALCYVEVWGQGGRWLDYGSGKSYY